MSKVKTIRFSRSGECSKNFADDPVIALLAVCIHSQQAAGFREAIDLRQVECPDCGSEGFNSGWGYWRFVCGAEVLTDGTPGEPCPKDKPDPPSGGRLTIPEPVR